MFPRLEHLWACIPPMTGNDNHYHTTLKKMVVTGGWCMKLLYPNVYSDYSPKIVGIEIKTFINHWILKHPTFEQIQHHQHHLSVGLLRKPREQSFANLSCILKPRTGSHRELIVVLTAHLKDVVDLGPW